MRLFYYPATHSLSSAARGVAHAFADLLVCTGLKRHTFSKTAADCTPKKEKKQPSRLLLLSQRGPQMFAGVLKCETP
jgi:hypothetical protein